MKTSYNIPPALFAAGTLLFALEPMVEGITILDTLVWAMVVGLMAFAIVLFIIQLIRDKKEYWQNITEPGKFAYAHLVISIVGVCIAYFYDSSILEVWVSGVVLELLYIFSPQIGSNKN